jgi:hypothetical protein
VPSFCRHGRLEANCPICSKSGAAAKAPRKPARRVLRTDAGAAGAPPSVAARRRSARAAGDLKVRRVARAADDGYEHDLVPGLRATADAVRLASELAFASARLEELSAEPPGLYAEVAGAAASGDVEEAAWLALQIAYLSPLEGGDPWSSIASVRTTWASGELPDADAAVLGPRTAHSAGRGTRTFEAYRTWAARAGSQSAALTADASWNPERRFERAFERLSLPGFARAARYEFLVLLGHLGVVELNPTALHLGDAGDETTLAAKRVFGIGDAMNLRRRASELARGSGVQIESLDLALVNFGRSEDDRVTAAATVDADPARADAIGALLGVPAAGEPHDSATEVVEPSDRGEVASDGSEATDRGDITSHGSEQFERGDGASLGAEPPELPDTASPAAEPLGVDRVTTADPAR